MKKSQLFNIITIALAVLAIVFILALPVLRSKTTTDLGILGKKTAITNVGGAAAIFGGGYVTKSGSSSVKLGNIFGFSPMLFIAFLLIGAAVVLAIVVLLTKKKALGFAVAGLLIVAAILFFMIKLGLMPSKDLKDVGTTAKDMRDIFKDFHLGIGLILGCVFCIGGAATAVLPAVVKD